ncbi:MULTISPECIES: hydroxyacylglutathione hydrolase [Pseudoalteromonas]|uniref:Hydroxyacylglutathione hydrolase n=1 Tax=Pseudoalteromonas aurantia 208 TaxID=1314867 RepID=A0ABR9EDP7_9GAMM|nr:MULTISPECIES: hydroxyacylglutathione hydrolase [Pseudoalteromonas]MBE0368897.1 hydroxyacylglutathione hydrolase [Pseudoalteromonas aurantia 208]MBQ4848152.1 hydroxyacylglutathione hydrolase [Pseudoalteromonas sp. MMG005]MBQ4852855.1 hydroxyacylglutathione hydrolase [Pseudoalteromonas sp. MMG012]
MAQVEPINAFDDNYIWAIRDTDKKQVWVVDPGDAEPVLSYLAQHDATLCGILITHHHWDHTNGVAELTHVFPNTNVYGPQNSKFKGITHALRNGDSLTVFEHTFSVLTTPGHTLDHICYCNDVLCFTGDTLFSAGCGRLFEGSAEQMWHSFKLFSQFNDNTLIYCTHEYSAANLAFAIAVEPDNNDIKAHIEWVTTQRKNNLPSLPTRFGIERKINPFLRSDLPHMLHHLPHDVTVNNLTPWHNFAALRLWKDQF